MIMKPASLVAAFALSVAAMSAAGAQKKTVVGITGNVFWYDGDTIWMERDSTETRVIYRGDTVIRRYSINGRSTESTMILRDGAAWTISQTDSTGAVRPIPGPSRPLPLLMANSVRDMLERELQSQEMRARVSALGSDAFGYVPLKPPERVKYSLPPATTIVHVQDTVFYIRGCPNAARLDTTVFQLFGEDSTRRLSSPARTFGKAMALSLISQMRMSLMRARTEMQSAPPPNLPGLASTGCK